ncbi:hypothetical protein V5799_031556 [Amblyomma americanum]|uniref:CCHC-type domain-containing protein n=1 Tax=Amblyomma americanum TaxID=6943 RepID=A0AAQ4DTP4_AMBAM
MASAKRPFTFFGRVPQGTTTLELTKILVTRFAKTELGGVQDFTGGKFEIFLKTRAAVERFLLDLVVEVKGTAVMFEYRTTRAKLVRAFGYSSEHHDVELVTALAPYGKIVSVSRESVPGFPTVTTGIRRIKMEMKSAVPNFLDVIDTTVQLEYEGVLRICRECGAQGHMGANCDTAQCSRCGAYGHEVCEAPCPKCGQDHPVKDCRKRTFASVVGGEEEHEEPATNWEQPTPVQPSNALSAQTSSADKGSCNTSALSSPPEDASEPSATPQRPLRAPRRRLSKTLSQSATGAPSCRRRRRRRRHRGGNECARRTRREPPRRRGDRRRIRNGSDVRSGKAQAQPTETE